MKPAPSLRRRPWIQAVLPWIASICIGIAVPTVAEAALGPAPQNYTRLIQQANERAIANDTANALATLGQAIKLYPYYADAYLARAAIEETREDNRAAIDDLSRAIAQGADAIDVYRRRAIAYDHVNDRERSLADLNWVLALDPSQIDLVFLRGQLKDTTGDHRGGIADFNRCLADPSFQSAKDQATVLYLRGRARQGNGDNVGAVIDFSRAIELDPNCRDAFFGRGKSKQDLEMYRASMADFTRAIEIDPKFYDAYLNRALMAEQLGNNAAALLDNDAAIKLDPKSDAAYINKADVEIASGQFDLGYATACQAVELHGRNFAVANIARGMAEYYRGDLAAATSSFDQAAAADSTNGAARVFLGITAEINGRFERAAANYDDAIRLHSATDAYVHRAIALWRAGREPPQQFLAPAVRAKLGGWTRAVALFLAGEIDEPKFTAEAERDEARTGDVVFRCERLYYSAIVKLQKGDKAAAKTLFAACLETKRYELPSYMLAWAEIKRL